MNPESDVGTGLAMFDTPWGWVGVAWSAQGLVGLTLPQATQEDALGQLPGASAPVPPPPAGLDLAALSDKLRRYFAGEEVVFDEPLDPTVGTVFRRKVWAVTRAIPRGQTLTYGEIARRVGSPGAGRAVGQAMAGNPWPVIVPCHRVVGHSGQLTGFGGGLAMKRQMLVMEGAVAPGET